MADFIAFHQGEERIGKTGLNPAGTVWMNLGTKSVDGTNPFAAGDEFAGMGTITGTGYDGIVGTVLSSTGGTFTFGTQSWSTGAATDWPNNCRSMVASDRWGTALWAWNLTPGGGARDMSAANTTENVIGTLIIT